MMNHDEEHQNTLKAAEIVVDDHEYKHIALENFEYGYKTHLELHAVRRKVTLDKADQQLRDVCESHKTKKD